MIEGVTLFVSLFLLMIDYKLIASSDDGTARLWDCGSGQCVSILSSVNCSINSCDVSTIPSLVTPPLSEPAG